MKNKFVDWQICEVTKKAINNYSVSFRLYSSFDSAKKKVFLVNKPTCIS